MKRAAIALTVLLFYATLALWAPERWPWGLFQSAVFLLAMWRVSQPRRWRTAPILLPLAGAAAWPLLQLALRTSLCPALTWTATLDWFTFLVVFALACDLFFDTDLRAWFLRSVALFGLALAAVATLQLYSSGGKVFWVFPSGYADGVLGPFVNRGQYSAWIELLLPVALYLAIFDRRRLLFSMASAVLFGSVIASTSRAGFVLVCAEVVAVVGLSLFRKTVPRKTLWMAAARFGALAAIAVAVAGWQGLQSRLQAGLAEPLRADAVHASIRMVQDRPWIGTGLGTWPTVYPAYASMDTGFFMNQAHNDWAQAAAEGGLPFFLLLFVFAALLCKPAIRSIYGVGIVAFLLHALVDYPMQQRPGLAAWFFAVAGATAVWNGRSPVAYDGPLRRAGP